MTSRIKICIVHSRSEAFPMTLHLSLSIFKIVNIAIPPVDIALRRINTFEEGHYIGSSLLKLLSSEPLPPPSAKRTEVDSFNGTVGEKTSGQPQV